VAKDENNEELEGEGRALENSLKSLERWAEDEGVSEDPAVLRLAKGIRSRQNLSMWANKDIDTFLPPPRAHGSRLLTPLTDFLFFVRNVAVFVPIFLTWRAIGAASQAFEQFAGFIPPDDDVNFLRYWQTGGENLLVGVVLPDDAIVPNSERLSSVAAFVAQIIVGIIVITIIASLLRVVDRRIRETSQLGAEQRRIEIVLLLESALHGYRQATPTSISETLAESLSALLEAAHQLGATAKQLEASTVGVAELGPAIKGFTEQLASAEERFEMGITPNLARLSTTVESLSGKLSADYERTLQQSLKGLDELAAQMQRTAHGAEVATTEVRSNVEQILAKLVPYAG
jgi:hypothetical protein